MPARMKSLIGEYLGQSSVFVGKKTKGGEGGRGGNMGGTRAGGDTGGTQTGYIVHIIC